MAGSGSQQSAETLKFGYILFIHTRQIHLTGILYLVSGCILPIFNASMIDNIICIFHSLEATVDKYGV